MVLALYRPRNPALSLRYFGQRTQGALEAEIRSQECVKENPEFGVAFMANIEEKL